MKKKYTFGEFVYQIYVKIAIVTISVFLLNPCMNLVMNIISKTEHKDAFFDAHYTDEPEIFFSSILGSKNEKEVK